MNLFSYGTLQQTDVQLATFNRLLEGHPDALVGYVVTIVDSQYRNVEPTNDESDVVEGTVFKVTATELELADTYEASANYVRIVVELRSGVRAWVYQHAT